MPERRRVKKSSPAAAPSATAEVERVLGAARQALQRGDGWIIDSSLYDRLREDLNDLKHPCNDPAVTKALRAIFSEITSVRQRIDESYSGLEAGQTLYDCRWTSAYFKCEMYVKFAMSGEVFELFTLHRHKEGARHEVH